MNTEDPLNWGDDKRFFPKFTRWIQLKTMIKSLLNEEPTSITLAFFPPLIVINMAWPFIWKKPQKTPHALVPLRPVLHLRLGWRRDMNIGRYYLTAAVKIIPRSMLW